MPKQNISGKLRDLPIRVINSIVEALGGTAVLLTSKENIVLRTQSGSLRNRIVDKISELQAKHGVILTEKGNIVPPAREEYIKWYLEQRAEAVAAQPTKDFSRWAIVHLQDALKFRKELVESLNIKMTAKEESKELVTA